MFMSQASAVPMELVSFVKRMAMKVIVEWAPGEANRDADQLANGEASKFDTEEVAC